MLSTPHGDFKIGSVYIKNQESLFFKKREILSVPGRQYSPITMFFVPLYDSLNINYAHFIDINTIFQMN